MAKEEKQVHASYLEATGRIDYGMTNDYMFRAILQRNEKVLKGLICSLLHLKPEEITSVRITNPIEPGDNYDAKEFILDIVVLLNDTTLINLEMQMENELNWEDRSLSYLCRSYDQLCRGEEYTMAKPVIHIGFLNFPPFAGSREFNASYKLMNVKNHRIYSDKFILNVIDLTQIEQATAEDKASRIDYWAKLFTATTWEEIRMLAKKSKTMEEASRALYELNADEITRQKCRARDDYYRLQNTINKKMEELTEENQSLTAEKESLTAKNQNLTAEKEKLELEKQALEKLLTEHGISYPVHTDEVL